MGKSFGVILLACFLLLYGLLTLTNLAFVASTIILGILALGAGILLLIGK